MPDQRVLEVLYAAGPQWGDRKPEDIVAALDAAGYVIAPKSTAEAATSDYIDVVFDGPPGPEAGRFVEVEDAVGRSISLGQWVQRPDGYWVLRFDPQQLSAACSMRAGPARA